MRRAPETPKGLRPDSSATLCGDEREHLWCTPLTALYETEPLLKLHSPGNG